MEPQQQQQQQQLSNLRIRDDDDGKQRDWASLPLDLLQICLAPLEGNRTAKRAALATCKAFARSSLRNAKDCGLILDVDRRAKFQPSARIWRELWGAGLSRQGQAVALVIGSRILGSPERCLSELLGAGECLAFVTSLWLKVRMLATAAKKQRSAVSSAT